MRIIHAVPDDDDIERFRQAAKEFENSNPEVKREFWISVGLYDKNGNVAEPYKGLFPEKA